MRLSIIIPTLNESRYIHETLGRLQRFRSRGHEVILVDGGSSDRTPERASASVDICTSAPRGRARQMNAGAALAHGDVLLFLHADTWLPDTAETDIAECLAVGESQWGRFDVHLSPSDWRLDLVARLMNFRSRLTGIATGDQAIFVEHVLFERVGGFPDVPLMEDIGLCRRLKRRCRPVCLERRVTTSSRRWVEDGVLRTVFLMWSLRVGYALGVEPTRLLRAYERA